MRSTDGKSSRASWGVFAALWVALIAAAAGSASAAPTETVLYSFTFGSDGEGPVGGLIADSAGNLYGTTDFCFAGTGPCDFGGNLGTVFKLAPGGIETVLHSFLGAPSDGAFPQAGLSADGSGNLYGTTADGTVFKLAPPIPPATSWTEIVLHFFAGGTSDGSEPLAGLIFDSSGNLYGTTSEGGGTGCSAGIGCGTVFKLAPPFPPATSWTETVLHSFAGGGSDGAFPEARLITDLSGNLYGTTYEGGGTGCSYGRGCGTVFKLAPGGTETVLYSFTGGSDGAQPSAGLIADGAGNLYGTTSSGGASRQLQCSGTDGFPLGCGVVFKLSPPIPPATNWTETVLYAFAGEISDGSGPSGLIFDGAGNLYGITASGGPGNVGTVFKLAPPIPPATSWTETVLYNFSFGGGGGGGSNPSAGLIADSAGNLYGTTFVGGSGTGCFQGENDLGCGTVFKLAGTGFVPPVPFLAFAAVLKIDFGTAPNTDAFQLGTSFTLSSTAPAFNPLTDPVTLHIGTFAVTIPGGSFYKNHQGEFVFSGIINGVTIKAVIKSTGTLRYNFQAGAQNASLTGTQNAVPVTLTIGSDSGTTSVTAQIFGTPSVKTAKFH